MAEFCMYCGKPLVNGACSCPQFRAANPGVQQQQPQQQQVQQPQQQMQQPQQQQMQQPQMQPQQQMQQGMPQMQQGMGMQPGMQQDMGMQPGMQQMYNNGMPMAPKAPSKIGAAFGAMFSKGFTSPIAAADATAALTPAAALIFCGSYALLAFLLMLIYGAVNHATGAFALIGLAALLAIILSTLIRAGMAYLFGNKSNPGVTFPQLLAKLSALKIYPAIAFVGMFLFSLFSTLFALIILVAGINIWIVFSTITLSKYMANIDENKRSWFIFIISTVSFVICVLFIYICGRSAVTSLFYSALGGGYRW